MNHYETAFLLTPNVADKDIEKFTAEVQELLRKHGATEVAEARVERRALAYPVKKHTEGHYVFIPFDGPASIPDDMRTELRHREELLRIGFVRRPELPPEPEVKPEAAPAEAKPEAAPAATAEAAPEAEAAPVAETEEEPAAEVAPAEEKAEPEPETAEEKKPETEEGDG